jgi:hypothetical protein
VVLHEQDAIDVHVGCDWPRVVVPFPEMQTAYGAEASHVSEQSVPQPFPAALQVLFATQVHDGCVTHPPGCPSVPDTQYANGVAPVHGPVSHAGQGGAAGTLQLRGSSATNPPLKCVT